MLQDKTEYFLKIRQRPCTQTPCLTISDTRERLRTLATLAKQFESKLEQCSLPKFGSKERQSMELRNLRSKIHSTATEIEKNTLRFECVESRVQEGVRAYVLDKLRTILIDFRNVNKKAPVLQDVEIKDSSDSRIVSETYDLQQELQQEVEYKNEAIKKSILTLTNTLVQLKVALKSQSSMIDSIDAYFDRSNEYLKQANREIEKLPERYCGLKDKIIYALLYVICILLCMLLFKHYKNAPPKQSMPERYQTKPLELFKNQQTKPLELFKNQKRTSGN